MLFKTLDYFAYFTPITPNVERLWRRMSCAKRRSCDRAIRIDHCRNAPTWHSLANQTSWRMCRSDFGITGFPTRRSNPRREGARESYVPRRRMYSSRERVESRTVLALSIRYVYLGRFSLLKPKST